MSLPQIPNIERTREYTQEFKGYNHNLRIAENEFYDDYNVSADNYPVLSTRKKRNRISEGFDGKLCGAIGRGEDLYYILYKNDVAKLYKNGEENSLNVTLENKENTRQMVFFGAYLIIYPDNIYFNTVNDNDFGELTLPLRPSKDYGFDVYLVKKDGEPTSYQRYVNFDTPITESVTLTEWNTGSYCPKDQTRNQYIVITNDKGKMLQLGYYDNDKKSCEPVNNEDLAIQIVTNVPHENIAKTKVSFDLTPFGAVLDGKDCKGEIEISEDMNYYDSLDGNNVIAYSEDEKILFRVHYDANDEWYYWSAIIKNAVMPYRGGRNALDGTWYTLKEGWWDMGNTNKYPRVPAPQITIWGDYSLLNLEFDYIVECQNRLWGCKYGDNDKKFINQIYATALGTFDDWVAYDGMADSAYSANVGSPGPFTGAAVINQNPVFFKEDYIHKVYVSGSGAHQVVTLECQGLQESSSKSLASVNGYIFYKTRNDVVLFDGTSITSISSALGDMKYENAVAGGSGNKYVMYCKNGDKGYIFTYDTKTGIWHRETAPDPIIDMTVCDGKLYMISDNAIDVHDDESGNESVPFMFETGDIGFSTPDKKYISRIDLRLSLEFGARMRFWMQYDSDGQWIESGALHGMVMTPKPISLPILPRRCDHFRIKVTGAGKFNLYAITKILEQGE